MEKGSNSTALTLALLLGIFLQVLFAFADTADTPNKTVVKFSKAYFKLDPAMSKYLCQNLAVDEETDAVSRFIQKAAREARDRGFNISYLRSYLFDITTHTITRSEDSARIRLLCKRRKLVNPIYAIVAKIFHIGNTYSVDEVIDVIKEGGKWKVCGRPFSLT